MLKIFVITALCAAFVLFASLVGMIVLSSENTNSDNQQEPAVSEQSHSENGATRTNQGAERDTKERKNKREWYHTFIDRPTEWLLVLFNGLLVVATIALFISGENSVDAARRSADAAKRSADVAVYSNRPWVKLKLEPDGNLAQSGVSLAARFKVKLTNIGGIPATRLKVTLRMVSGVQNLEGIRDKITPTIPGDLGQALFPKEASEQFAGAIIPKVEVENPNEIGRTVGFGDRRAMMSLVGAVEYQFPGGSGKTAKVFHLYTDEENGLIGGVQIDKLPLPISMVEVAVLAIAF